MMLVLNTTNTTLPDGSKITGVSEFTRGDGTKGKLADTVLVAETDGHRVVRTTTGTGTKTTVTKAYDGIGDLLYAITSVTTANGLSIQNSYDDNGDGRAATDAVRQIVPVARFELRAHRAALRGAGTTDRLQSITTVVNGNGSRTETLINKRGNNATTAILENSTVTTTSADGRNVTIARDSTGGGWVDQREVRNTAIDQSQSNVTTNYARDGVTIKAIITENVTADGKLRYEYVDEDATGGYDTLNRQRIIEAAGIRVNEFITFSKDGSWRSEEKEELRVAA